MKKILLVLFTVLLSVLLLYLYFFHDGFSSDQNIWGNFGSYFGGVAGTILSFVAIIYIYEDIKGQKKNQQRQEDQNNFFKLLENFNHMRFEVFESEETTSSDDSDKKEVKVYKGIHHSIYLVNNLYDSLRRFGKLSKEDAIIRIVETNDFSFKIFYNILEELLVYVEKDASKEKYFQNIIYANLTKFEKFFIKYVDIPFNQPDIYRRVKKYKNELSANEDFTMHEADDYTGARNKHITRLKLKRH